jgi:hypothetical protein
MAYTVEREDNGNSPGHARVQGFANISEKLEKIYL